MAMNDGEGKLLDDALDFLDGVGKYVRGVIADLRRHKSALRAAAEDAYTNEVVNTGMEELIIGVGLDYQDREDWIDHAMDAWLDIGGQDGKDI